MCVCEGGGDAPLACPLPSIRICVCVRLYACMCAREASAFVCGGGGGREVMLPWRVPCSPEKGFLKKRGMPARCTSAGVMLGVLLRLARVLLLHHHLLAQVHFPTYLARPSLPLGPSCHIRWSLPTYLYPPYPLARPVISRAT